MERGNLSGLELLIEGSVIEVRRRLGLRHELLDDEDNEDDRHHDEEDRPEMLAHAD